MREYGAVIDDNRGASGRFDTVIEWLLVGLLAFMPLAFGVVHAWSEEVVITLSGAIVICFLLKLVFDRHQGIIWSWSYVPVGLFILIGILQLIPLSTGLISIISPNTAVLKTELLGDLSNADDVLKSITLSFYPNATKHDLRLILAVIGVFVVVLNVFRRPEQIKRLLMAITVIGAVIAVIALTQNVFRNDKIYWLVSSIHCRGYSGPFVNHSNYGQFMNLSIGAALGWLCVKLNEAFAGRKVTLPTVVDYLTAGSGKSLWLLVVVIGLCAASVFASLTRGGMISMLAAMTLTTLLFTSRQSCRSYGWIMVVIAFFAFTCILYIGFDTVYDRLASLRDFDKAENFRLQILKDIAIAWTIFPILGTGLGTHSVVYPMFDRSTITALATHAENEYAQVLEETGLLGLGLLIILGVIVWSSCVRNIRSTGQPIRSAAYGLCFGISAILIHSLSDFGQHLPANAILSAIFCALLLVLARSSQSRRRRAAPALTPSGNSTLLRTGVLLGGCILWAWTLIGADNARVARSHWEKAVAMEKGLADRNWQATEQEYAGLISFAAAASDREPENIEYRHWLNVYRWHSISPATDPDTGEFIISEDLMPTVRNIVDDFHKARVICPTYGPTYSIVGQIEKFVLNDNSGAERIRKGFRLAPCNPTACFVAGYLDVAEGKNEDCIEKLQKAMQLDRGLFGRVVNIYVNHLSRPHLAILAAGDDIGQLSHVVNVLEDMQYNDLAGQTREKIKDLLEAMCSQPDAPASALISLGNIYRKQQDSEAAIKCYRRALMLDYGQVYWRLELAELLAKTERIPEALREAQICRQLRPQLKTAENLVMKLSVNPAVFDKEN